MTSCMDTPITCLKTLHVSKKKKKLLMLTIVHVCEVQVFVNPIVVNFLKLF